VSVLRWPYISQVQIVSREGVPYGYFVGCNAYLDNARLTVVLRHRSNPRLRRPVADVASDPPTIELENPQNYEGFVALADGRIGLRGR
jgi:hypothetical protein